MKMKNEMRELAGELTKKFWNNMTPEQKKYVIDNLSWISIITSPTHISLINEMTGEYITEISIEEENN